MKKSIIIAMIQTLLTNIDCIHFAKLSLYSVNTAPVCKFCRGCTVKKKDDRIFILGLFLLYTRRQ